MNNIPSKNNIIETHSKINEFIHRTPVLTSSAVNSIAGCSIFFKCENFQKVGAFKFRGAINAVLSIPQNILRNGVATHSSGNHAAALSLAAKNMNVPAYIVMPETAPETKKKAVAEYGAKITFCKPNQKAREETLHNIVAETGANFVHPYDDYRVITGQATAAKELIEDSGKLDIIMAPVGGGGLLSGTSLSVKYFSPETEVIAGEPAGADDAFRSIRDSKIYPSVDPQTIADGLLTSLSEKTYRIIKDNVSEIFTVQEETIVKAMRIIWERMKIIIEPSSAVPLAAILENKARFADKKVGLIISGGNVDLAHLPFK